MTIILILQTLESVNKVVNTLQAKAEFGDIQHTLSLRVANMMGICIMT